MEKNHTCMKIKETKKDHYPYTPQRKQEKKQTEPLTRFQANDSGNFYSEAPG